MTLRAIKQQLMTLQLIGNSVFFCFCFFLTTVGKLLRISYWAPGQKYPKDVSTPTENALLQVSLNSVCAPNKHPHQNPSEMACLHVNFLQRLRHPHREKLFIRCLFQMSANSVLLPSLGVTSTYPIISLRNQRQLYKQINRTHLFFGQTGSQSNFLYSKGQMMQLVYPKTTRVWGQREEGKTKTCYHSTVCWIKTNTVITLVWY